jgi:hypothetical protein
MIAFYQGTPNKLPHLDASETGEDRHTMMIEDFGARVASVWEGLRLTTQRLVERALQSNATTAAAATSGETALPSQTTRTGMPYDPRADWELSRLLAALDERAHESGAASTSSLNAEQSGALRRMADTCAAVLQNGTQSAEVFAQLILRALNARDYARIDRLADALSARLAPSEICVLARHAHPALRALAQEALAQSPTTVLLELLVDPIDSDTARDALELQATEYDSEHARRIIQAIESDAIEDDEL